MWGNKTKKKKEKEKTKKKIFKIISTVEQHFLVILIVPVISLFGVFRLPFSMTLTMLIVFIKLVVRIMIVLFVPPILLEVCSRLDRVWVWSPSVVFLHFLHLKTKCCHWQYVSQMLLIKQFLSSKNYRNDQISLPSLDQVPFHTHLETYSMMMIFFHHLYAFQSDFVLHSMRPLHKPIKEYVTITWY